ncbi:MAG: ANTAR domain-containing protein [Mycobacterium sp.]|nr:ANTAR domain-containing protein [Mycobacterium sp.]
MPVPPFHPRSESAHHQLFDRILERVKRDLPDAVALAVTVHPRNGGVTEFASCGFGSAYLAAQLSGLGGPAVDAVEYQVPVLSLDLWSDDRWPALTADSVLDRVSGHDDQVRSAKGAASVPGIWRADETVVLSCLLDRPADASTVATLIGYEQLITAALMTSATQEGNDVADMLAVLQSRGAIEQAKGMVMACLRCDADQAWATLRRASHESNVKLRVLAVALVEYVGRTPAEQPGSAAPIAPDERARKAARLLWAVLSHAFGSVSDGD